MLTVFFLKKNLLYFLEHDFIEQNRFMISWYVQYFPKPDFIEQNRFQNITELEHETDRSMGH